jgi:hypothetical protein
MSISVTAIDLSKAQASLITVARDVTRIDMREMEEEFGHDAFGPWSYAFYFSNKDKAVLFLTLDKETGAKAILTKSKLVSRSSWVVLSTSPLSKFGGR